MRTRTQPRDERGWRIPRDGTHAKKVYDLLVAGKTSTEIRERLRGHSKLVASVMIFRIKNPDKHCAAERKLRVMHKLRKRWADEAWREAGSLP